MKLALLGKGKTGSKVRDLWSDEITVFDSQNPISQEALAGHDVIISFLPGHVFIDYLDILVATKIPVVTGSTGIEYPQQLKNSLIANKIPWIYSHNFSLGMNIVKIMIEQMSLLKKLIPESNSTIHEIHHTKKVDSPSGTALHWQDWYGGDCEITAERTGDVIGYHEITFDSKTEKVKLSHEAKDRAIFAQGAIWAARLLASERSLKPGLHQFNTVVKNYLNI